MATCRVAITMALRMLRVVAPGDDPTADELATGVDGVNDLLMNMANGRGPLLDVDVTAATYTPGENQRLRIQSGDTAAVTLPNSVPIYGSYNPNDYGFVASLLSPPLGSTATADGYQYRPPHDGARIEIVGTTQGTYWYRADINTWQLATGLTTDSELPINQRYQDAFNCVLAERLSDDMGGSQMTPTLQRRINRAHTALVLQTGTSKDPVMAQYF